MAENMEQEQIKKPEQEAPKFTMPVMPSMPMMGGMGAMGGGAAGGVLSQAQIDELVKSLTQG